MEGLGCVVDAGLESLAAGSEEGVGGFGGHGGACRSLDNNDSAASTIMSSYECTIIIVIAYKIMRRGSAKVIGRAKGQRARLPLFPCANATSVRASRMNHGYCRAVLGQVLNHTSSLRRGLGENPLIAASLLRVYSAGAVDSSQIEGAHTQFDELLLREFEVWTPDALCDMAPPWRKSGWRGLEESGGAGPCCRCVPLGMKAAWWVVHHQRPLLDHQAEPSGVLVTLTLPRTSHPVVSKKNDCQFGDTSLRSPPGH